jgi:hypothetical protein
MPRKRRTGKHRAPITAEAVKAFMAGDWTALHRALDLRPWEASPLDADTPEPPAWDALHGSTAYSTSWPAAAALRADLMGRAA